MHFLLVPVKLAFVAGLALAGFGTGFIIGPVVGGFAGAGAALTILSY